MMILILWQRLTRTYWTIHSRHENVLAIHRGYGDIVENPQRVRGCTWQSMSVGGGHGNPHGVLGVDWVIHVGPAVIKRLRTPWLDHFSWNTDLIWGKELHATCYLMTKWQKYLLWQHILGMDGLLIFHSLHVNFCILTPAGESVGLGSEREKVITEVAFLAVLNDHIEWACWRKILKMIIHARMKQNWGCLVWYGIAWLIQCISEQWCLNFFGHVPLFQPENYCGPPPQLKIK